jgi:hypothetical protein
VVLDIYLEKDCIMKLILATVIAMSMSSVGFSKIYKCDRFITIEEYSVEINDSKKTASFFDNDTITELTLKQTKILESLPAQELMIFEGVNPLYKGKIRISFNKTKSKVTVFQVVPKKTTELGTSICK